MRLLKQIYCWLKSPSDLEEMRGIGPQYAERLRRAGVETPSELCLSVQDSTQRREIASKSGLSESLLQQTVASSRKPWYRNYKIMGLVALLGVVGTAVTAVAWFQARRDAVNLDRRLQVMLLDQQLRATRVWSLSVQAEFIGLPASLFEEYWRVVAGPNGSVAKLVAGPGGRYKELTKGNLKRAQELADEGTKEFLLEHWLAVRSRRGEWFPAAITVRLSGQPLLEFQIQGCSELIDEIHKLAARFDRRTVNRTLRQCQPGVELLAPYAAPIVLDRKNWSVEKNSQPLSEVMRGRGGVLVFDDSEISAAVTPVRLGAEFGAEKLERFSATIGPLMASSFSREPSVEFCVPTNQWEIVTEGKVQRNVADIPKDIVAAFRVLLPKQVNVLIVTNQNLTSRYTSFILDSKPEQWYSDSVCFEYVSR